MAVARRDTAAAIPDVGSAPFSTSICTISSEP